jgi:drug/metabolite transporter (DMT)-like permease
VTGSPPVRWAGLAIGLGGVALLAGRARPGRRAAGREVLLTALGYAIGPLIANRKLADLPPVAVNAACLGAAAVVYAPFAALTWPRAMPSVQVLGALAGLGVICTAAAFLVFFRLIAEVGPARATVITYVNPAVAVALGVLVLGEHLTPRSASPSRDPGRFGAGHPPRLGRGPRAAPEGPPVAEEGATTARSD